MYVCVCAYVRLRVCVCVSVCECVDHLTLFESCLFILVSQCIQVSRRLISPSLFVTIQH